MPPKVKLLFYNVKQLSQLVTLFGHNVTSVEEIYKIIELVSEQFQYYCLQ